ncbi:hypothetical protein GGR28_000194 [Lewinella aquimaris]|uniref:Uncharacterized protein n=1 Tax=Neolewinella aquimaris TaxID=1835722 RepID=A0A840E0W9_9BACT|nr:hypothetical protein [Neolewinella aquimaris]
MSNTLTVQNTKVTGQNMKAEKLVMWAVATLCLYHHHTELLYKLTEYPDCCD